jgi:hypothetical protein
MSPKTMAEVIREELCKGSYQMSGDTLPYETQAASVARALSAAGFGDARAAKAEALHDAADWLHGDEEEDREEGVIGLWLRGRAKGIEAGA